MPALNFQERFAELVESGEKRQTIRRLRKDGRDPKPGDTLYLYTGQRTKHFRKLGEAVCKEVIPITIDFIDEVYFDHDYGRPVDAYELIRLGKRDGFDDWESCYEWFERTHGLPFDGLVIRW